MEQKSRGVSRRKFLTGIGASAVSAAAVPAALAPGDVLAAPASAEDSATIPVTLLVNGVNQKLQLEPRTTLADALRYHLGLTGTKVVCDRGSCGACTVLAGGETIYSCMMLAADAQGQNLRTVESLAAGGKLSAIQAEFVAHDAMMCGFCTPGFVVSCTALVERNPRPTEEDVREAIRGNLCRCGTYPRIFEACLAATGARKGPKNA